LTPADTPLPQTNYIAAEANIGNARVWWVNQRSRPWNVLEDNTERDSGEIGWKAVEWINLAQYRNQWWLV
jgi:hypothetical protein